MSNFSNLYARSYDLLYADKDYALEVNYISDLIKEFAPRSTEILNLGCGTGSHDFLLAKEGYKILGIDQSESMILRAQELAGLSKFSANVSFSLGDIRKLKLDRKFDVVLSLFHVMSYQINNEDLENVFQTAKEHLNPGGVFIFDCWYGPGVLTDPPQVRIKRLEDKNIKLFRIAEPKQHVTQNIIDVNYELHISSKENNESEIVRETHRMRYIFDTEINWLSLNSSFKKIAGYEWMTRNEPSLKSWNTVYVCRLNNRTI